MSLAWQWLMIYHQVTFISIWFHNVCEIDYKEGNQKYSTIRSFTGQKFVGRYASLGCWKDVPTRAIASLEHHFPEQYNVRINPIQKCFEVAMSFGYQVFAVQDGGQCFGSPTAQNTYAKYGSSRYCSYGTGGPMANNVYRMKNGNHEWYNESMEIRL